MLRDSRITPKTRLSAVLVTEEWMVGGSMRVIQASACILEGVLQGVALAFAD